jgi:uncharacterized protein DUF6308
MALNSVSIPAIQVAGRNVSDPVAVVSGYCHRHAATLRHYDWLAGRTESLTRDLIAATRRPWMNSRISRIEERWLLDRAATAPWETVAAAALLRDADPEQCGGLYDNAVQLYQHFCRDRPRGVNRAKISKCLYLMRPGLIPILDSRLIIVYRQDARTAARGLMATLPGRAPVRRAYWAAIRRDLLRATHALTLLREQMRNSSSDSVVPEAAERLSDVRLLDILAWSTAGKPSPTTNCHRQDQR